MILLALVACTRTAAFDETQIQEAVGIAAGVRGTYLMNHVQALVDARAAETPYFPPEARYAGMPFTHVASAAYVAAELAELGLEVEVIEGGEPGREVRSVVAEIPGGSHADEVVLLSAHHDAWFAGADDNATGVAVILEAARVLAGSEPDRTIRIVAWDREEEGLVGAAEYVRTRGTAGLYRIVNLDSVGYTDHTPGSQQSILGLDAPDTGDFLAVIAPEFAADDMLRAVALASHLDAAPPLAGVLAREDAHAMFLTDLLRSDHAPFWEAGVPGLFFTDTTEFRNPRYHTAEDTVDTLDPDFLDQVGGFTAGVVAAWAEAG